jgi:hypothetical protein
VSGTAGLNPSGTSSAGEQEPDVGPAGGPGRLERLGGAVDT